MRTIDTVRRSGVGIRPDQTIADAAGIMEHAGIGSLAVLDEGQLVGIVTDRDLVRRALARQLPSDARIDSVMSAPVVSIAYDADIHSAFTLLRTHGVRRLAVVQDKQFVGMITVDDLLIELASDLVDLTRPIAAEILSSHRDSAVPIAF